MSVSLTVMHAADGAMTTAAVSASDKVSALHAAVTSAFKIPAVEQRFLFNDKPLDNRQTLTAAGIKDGDLLIVTQQEVVPATPPSSSSSQQPSGPLSTQDQALINQVKSDPVVMGEIRNRLPKLHRQLMASDPEAGRLLLQYVRSITMGGGLNMMGAETPAASTQQPQASLDPMSIEGQKAIEEGIRQENVNENMEAALEHNPESFGRVVMLFVDCKINAVEGIKAFVDSGAQQTIISKECASRCGLLHLMDSRFQGVARGVGTAKIYGRIHLALMTLGKSVFEITFTVMDAIGGGYEVLLGLDMLRKHAAVIDLAGDCLRMGDVSVPFLSEKDIPLLMRDAAAEMEEEEREKKKLAENLKTQVIPSSAGAAASSSNAASQSATAPTASTISQTDVQRIVELGFPKETAEKALRLCGGNAEQAIETLLAATSPDKL